MTLATKMTLLPAAVGINEACDQARDLTTSTGRYHYADYSDLDNVMFVMETSARDEDEFFVELFAETTDQMYRVYPDGSKQLV